MERITVKVNSRQVESYLKSASVQAELGRRARAAADAAGPGYEASVIVGATRARASVITATPEAMADNARNQSLLRAIGAQRRG